MAALVRLEREPQPSGSVVALVTLDDPDRRNILSPEMLADLVPALRSLAADESVGSVVITGSPPAFCGGAPLSSLAETHESATADEARAKELLASIYAGFEAAATLPMPTIAAVNGPAVGAGMNLAMACDVIVAGRSARFDPRFLKLGLHPGGAHTWALSRLIGIEGARAMVLFGEVLDGDGAAARGLAWRCFEDEDLVESALQLARAAAAAPRELARRTKATLATAPGAATREQATAIELVEQLWSVGQQGFRDALAAARPGRRAR